MTNERKLYAIVTARFSPEKHNFTFKWFSRTHNDPREMGETMRTLYVMRTYAYILLAGSGLRISNLLTPVKLSRRNSSCVYFSLLKTQIKVLLFVQSFDIWGWQLLEATRLCLKVSKNTSEFLFIRNRLLSLLHRHREKREGEKNRKCLLKVCRTGWQWNMPSSKCSVWVLFARVITHGTTKN